MALAVKSAVRDLAKEHKMRVSGDIWNELDEKIKWKIKMAVKRAKANGRKTLKAADL